MHNVKLRTLFVTWKMQNLSLEIQNKFGNTEGVAYSCSAKKVFLEISQNSQENTCVRISKPATLSKRNSGAGILL